MACSRFNCNHRSTAQLFNSKVPFQQRDAAVHGYRLVPSMNLNPIRAVLFDRDGVLNVDHDFVCSPDRFEFIEGAPEAIKWLNARGILAIVVTNQSGIARGKFTQREYDSFEKWFVEEFARHGAKIDATYHCPHHPSITGNCDCRKPEPGMIIQALLDYQLLPGEAIIIGDKARDVQAGEAAGVRGILFEGGSLLKAVQAAIGIDD